MRTLNDLIQLMLGRVGNNSSPIGSETDQWKANREAELITGLNFLDEINNLLDDNPDSETRRMCYRILGFLAKNTRESNVITILIKYISEEKNACCLYELLMAICDGQLNYKFGTESIVYWSDDINELLRNAAIRALGYSMEKEKAENALLSLLESPYDDFGIRYAAQSLRQVGSYKSLPVLKALLNETSNDEVLESLNLTIAALSH